MQTLYYINSDQDLPIFTTTVTITNYEETECRDEVYIWING